MSPYQTLLLICLLVSCYAAHAKQTKAPTPWGIQAPKPGSAIKSLSLERIPLPGVTGAESLAFDRRGLRWPRPQV
nr:unnamed protein product [Digitaria exilis]